MELEYKEQASLRQYLLGSLPPGEIGALEERLLTDAAFYDELLMVEDELIDQYLSGEQSQAERESFESHFSQPPERQQKIRFARTLKQYLKNTSEGQADVAAAEPSRDERVALDRRETRKRSFFPFLAANPILNYALAASLVLIIGVVSWTVINRLNPGSHEPGQALAVVLTPGLTRDGGEIKKISIPPGTDTVQLQLELPKADYSTYRVEILTSERTSVFVAGGLQPATANKSINVSLPASLLRRDDYSVKLSGKHADGVYEDVASYVFRVLS
ncbi:MAG: anti-sigma factor family protein [Pyrinomonadaceae bacterium]